MPAVAAALAVVAADVASAAATAEMEAAMVATAAAAHTALVAGATGLVGREILLRLSADKRYAALHGVGRRPAPPDLLAAHPQLTWHTVSFAATAAWPPPLPPLDEAYIALGTTIAQAGSQQAFRAVDLDAVVAVAQAARAVGATRLGVVSAMGAQARSPVFYNRVKGEMEEAVCGLGYTTVVIARPSLLEGARDTLDQPSRQFEKLAQGAMRLLKPVIPANYRAVQAADVAQALIRQVQAGLPGRQVLLSGSLQQG